MKPGSLNLLEPLGPVQACNGIAVPSNIFVAVTALICMYLSYIILVRVTVYLILALNFRSLVFTGVFQILL